MEYAEKEDFVVDFINRTQKNLHFIEQYSDFEVTQLINSLLGLLVIPEQKCYDELNDNLVSAELLSKLKKIIKSKGGDDLKTIARHLRNSACHCNFECTSEKDSHGEIPKIIKNMLFIDRNDKGTVTFKMEMPVDLFREFVFEFSEGIKKEITENKSKSE